MEVGEDATFMPPSASVPGYAGTLTVADDGTGILGMDVTEVYSDPYGSISPSSFEVGGTERDITALYIHPYGGPDFDLPALYLEFDTGFDGSNIEWTLTIGTTVYNSTDATREGSGYEWLASSTWAAEDMVAVEIGFVEVVPFREGTTLEEVGAFTTPTMPPTLAFEAEMTASTRIMGADTRVGYNSSSSTGSLSGSTFEVGGVEYTVKQLEHATAQSFIYLSLSPAGLPLQFELEAGGSTYRSQDAHVTTNSGVSTYRWAVTGSLWTQSTQVDVKLDIGLINICGRSQAVAYAIVKATPSSDYCHMTSQLDLANITELDLPGGKGTGLTADDFAGLSGLTRLDLSGYDLGGHTWNQLPVGLFDGLDNLEVLDLSDTLLQRGSVPVGVFDGLDSLEILRIAYAGYQDRGINFVDEDIFRGLDTLRELDVRPIRPSDDVLAPLTSLQMLNGKDYTP